MLAQLGSRAEHEGYPPAMVTGPASTPVAAVVVAVLVTFFGKGPVQDAFRHAAVPAADPALHIEAGQPAPDDRRLADSRRRTGPPRRKRRRSKGRRAQSQPANSSAGPASSGPPFWPLASAAAALLAALGFRAGRRREPARPALPDLAPGIADDGLASPPRARRPVATAPPTRKGPGFIPWHLATLGDSSTLDQLAKAEVKRR